MGAWIETFGTFTPKSSQTKLLPLWEHGLKLFTEPTIYILTTLLPLWEHGLKPSSLGGI